MSYGTKIERSHWNPLRSVAADPEAAPGGNLVLRVGREIDETQARAPDGRQIVAEGAWTQTEHVVMEPSEGRAFAKAIVETLRFGSESGGRNIVGDALSVEERDRTTLELLELADVAMKAAFRAMPNDRASVFADADARELDGAMRRIQIARTAANELDSSSERKDR